MVIAKLYLSYKSDKRMREGVPWKKEKIKQLKLRREAVAIYANTI